MTSDEFHAQYRRGQYLTSEGVRTSLAQEMRKGRIVLVHELVTATEPERQRAQSLLRQLAPDDASQIIGTFDVDGGPVIVTKFLPSFTSFLGWLEAAVAERSTTVIDTRDGPATIESAIRGDRPPMEQPVSPALEDASERQDLGAPAPPSGSFTKLFGESAPTAPSAAERGTDGPVDFTQLFGSSGDLVPGPPQTKQADTGLRSGRDTEQVNPVTPDDPAPPARASESAPLQPASARLTPIEEPATGDFTHLFGGEASPSAPIPSPSKPPPLRTVPLEHPQAFSPPAPVIHRQPPTAPPHDEMGLEPSAQTFREPIAPTPPRIRLGALEGAPPNAAPRPSRPGQESGAPVVASTPSVPFSLPPPLGTESVSGPGPPAAPLTPRPDLRAAARPLATHVSPAEGGYTEVLTPARPPLNAGTLRAPTPGATPMSAPSPPRASYTPLIAGLSVFVVLAVAFVVYFVMSAS